MEPFAQTYAENRALVLRELDAALSAVDPASVRALMDLVAGAQQVFFVGVGRVLLSLEAIAKRWATPFRLLKVGGAFGQKMVMPDQKMLEQVRDMVNKMDLKSGLVVPFYVTVETHGTEGQVLNVEDKVKEVKEDIVVALGLSRSLVTGDGPNFATASVSTSLRQ